MTAKKLFVFPLIALALGLVFAGCKKSDSGASEGQKYHCPMHPTYVSDRPGDCPICNMKLVPIKADKAAAKPVAPAADDKTAHIKPGQFYCPMDLNVISNAPGLCPECNMKLIEKKEAPAGHEGHTTSTTAPPVPGRIAISLSPDKQQMIGLTTGNVEKRELSQLIRTTATFEHDETKLARFAPRFGGWVRDLKVNYTGQRVEKGEP
ncbi:MAG: heavy metal-binding domain-containing protein, partial [Verrucomicrobiota bacterium]